MHTGVLNGNIRPRVNQIGYALNAHQLRTHSAYIFDEETRGRALKLTPINISRVERTKDDSFSLPEIPHRARVRF